MIPNGITSASGYQTSPSQPSIAKNQNLTGEHKNGFKTLSIYSSTLHSDTKLSDGAAYHLRELKLLLKEKHNQPDPLACHYADKDRALDFGHSQIAVFSAMM